MTKGEELLKKCFEIFNVKDYDCYEANIIFKEYNRGAYNFCKKHDLLHNNSAEEFSIAWMTWWNENTSYSYY